MLHAGGEDVDGSALGNGEEVIEVIVEVVKMLVVVAGVGSGEFGDRFGGF